MKYEKVISLQGTAVEALRGKAFHNWGVTLILEGKDEDGLEKYESAHEAGLRDPLLFHNLGAALRRLRRTEEPIAKYKEAIALYYFFLACLGRFAAFVVF